MTPEPNPFVTVRSARQIRLGGDVDALEFAARHGSTDGVTLRGELAPSRVSIAAVATCLASVLVWS